MKSHPIYGALMATLLLGVVGAEGGARAGLIEKDYQNPGDKLLTLDTTTNLQWLDITETINMSYNAANAAFPTFRHATLAEVQGILVEFGATLDVGFTVGNLECLG